MLASLEDVRDRIVALLDPESIILFGSRARGDASGSSDADILIVKETVERPIDRRIAAERILADRTMPLDILVYTPEEVRHLYSLGSPFIQDVVENGRVLYMRKATEVWMREADEELSSARILGEHGMRKGACLHGQRCVERCLKALILEKADKPERTHDLVSLLGHVRRLGWTLELEADEAVFLNSVYKGRYPSEEGLLPHGEPDAGEAARAVGVASKVLAATTVLLTGAA